MIYCLECAKPVDGYCKHMQDGAHRVCPICFRVMLRCFTKCRWCMSPLRALRFEEVDKQKLATATADPKVAEAYAV